MNNFIGLPDRLGRSDASIAWQRDPQEIQDRTDSRFIIFA